MVLIIRDELTFLTPKTRFDVKMMLIIIDALNKSIQNGGMNKFLFKKENKLRPYLLTHIKSY